MNGSYSIRRLLAATALALVASACTSTEPASTATSTSPPSTVAATTTAPPPPSSTTTRPPPELSAEAEGYLLEAIGLMHEWSINRDEVDWDYVTDLAYRIADGAETTEDTYRAVEAALGALRDDHSVFFTPAETRTFDSGPASFVEPTVEVGDDGIGYVSIGRYVGNIGEQADAYAAALAQQLTETMPAACGWIVDLRSNTGGNMWPMIGGLAPLLGEGQVGSFVYPHGLVEPWTLTDGVAYWDDQPMTTFATPIPEDQPPVAVLIGRGTASSGEATTVAFHGRPDTRLFGQSTTGLTTSNEPLVLSDGAMMALTMSVFTDRTGQSYGQDIPVTPDEAITGDPTPAATRWLLAQEACAG